MNTSIVTKGRTEQILEAKHGVPLPELLRTLYHEEGLSQQAVADRLEVSRATVVRWMKEFGIPTRDRRAVTGETVA
jgi:transposase